MGTLCLFMDAQNMLVRTVNADWPGASSGGSSLERSHLCAGLAERAGAQSQRGTDMNASKSMSAAALGDQEQFPPGGGNGDNDGGGDNGGSGANGGGDSDGDGGGADRNGGWGVVVLAIMVTAVALVHSPAASAESTSTERVSRQAPPPWTVPPSVTVTHPCAHLYYLRYSPARAIRRPELNVVKRLLREVFADLLAVRWRLDSLEAHTGVVNTIGGPVTGSSSRFAPSAAAVAAARGGGGSSGGSGDVQVGGRVGAGVGALSIMTDSARVEVRRAPFASTLHEVSACGGA